jgi:hypothetical protein
LSFNAKGPSAPANSGSGGGGAYRSGPYNVQGGNGGSGTVIIRVPNTVTATFSAGVSHILTTPTGFNVYEITAAGASDTVTFGAA